MAASDLVKRIPPPDKLKAKGKPMVDDYSDDETGDDGADEAAAVSAMEEFMTAVKGSDAEEALRAWRNVKETC